MIDQEAARIAAPTIGHRKGSAPALALLAPPAPRRAGSPVARASHARRASQGLPRRPLDPPLQPDDHDEQQADRAKGRHDDEKGVGEFGHGLSWAGCRPTAFGVPPTVSRPTPRPLPVSPEPVVATVTGWL